VLESPNFVLESPNFVLESPNFVLESPNFVLESPNFVLESIKSAAHDDFVLEIHVGVTYYRRKRQPQDRD